MKVWIKPLISLLCVLPSLVFAANGFMITGKITGVKNGTVAIVDFMDGDQSGLKAVHAQSVRISDGQFVFKGTLDHPGMVKLKISTKFISVFLDNQDYKIEGAFNALTTNSLVGGQSNADFIKFNKSGQSMTEFIKANPKSMLSAYLAFISSAESAVLAKNCYAWLANTIKQSWYGKRLKAVIDQYDRSAALIDFPILGLKNLDNQPIDLNKFKGSVVVLDFWASWCGPCRAFIPKMKALYEQYQHKAVRFVSISADDDRSNWQFAVAKEQMPWMQVLADGGFTEAGGIKSLLSIYHIPYVIILDKNGKIASRLDYDHKGEIKSVVDRLL